MNSFDDSRARIQYDDIRVRIQKELRGQPYSLLREFEKAFPCPHYKDTLENDNWILIIPTPQGWYDLSMTGGPKWLSCQNFLDRWKRFQNLKAFI